jgi:putative tricarboxylic transport membrane protein
MLDGIIGFGTSLLGFMTPTAVAYALASSLVGFIIGALPGLTATMGVALMTTLTIKLPSSDALLILVCTYVGAIYGGSRSAILLNIPGTPASAASCIDGHALAKQGLAGRAMGIATTGSILGTWIGMAALAFFTPVLGEMALKFGAYEFFWLAVFGVVISGNLTGNDPLKGWMAGFPACSSPASDRRRSSHSTASPSATATSRAASRSSLRWSAPSAWPRSSP